MKKDIFAYGLFLSIVVGTCPTILMGNANYGLAGLVFALVGNVILLFLSMLKDTKKFGYFESEYINDSDQYAMVMVIFGSLALMGLVAIETINPAIAWGLILLMNGMGIAFIEKVFMFSFLRR